MFGRKRSRQDKSRRTATPGSPVNRDVTAIEQFVVEEVELSGGAKGTVGPKPRKRPPAWLPAAELLAGWIGLWALLIVATLATRSLWPVDETRALAVAWEMWARKSFLVPLLNGDVDTHPPLFFWFIHLGWLVGGVNEWWPRLVPAVFALLSLFVTGRLAKRLWPEESEIARYVPLVLLGTLFWAVYGTWALPDTLLVFFTLLAFWGLFTMWRHRDMRAWMLLGLALGFAVLAHGATVYFYVLPVALVAPLWSRGIAPRWRYWYADLFKALFLGALVVAAWLVPVVLREGLPYAVRWLTHALRPVTLEFFPGPRPWWWYAALLPLVFLPWSVLPLAWMRLWHVRREPLNAGMTFCLAWLILPPVALSFLAVKQPQLLLPLLPVGALAVTWLLLGKNLVGHGEDKSLTGMAVPLIVLGCLLAVWPRLPRVEFLPDFLWDLSPFVGLGVVGVGIAFAWLPLRELRQRVRDTAVIGALFMVFVILGVGTQFDTLNQVTAVAQTLAQAQARQRPVAHVGGYRGEFQFAGRLTQPLHVIEPARAPGWAAAYPSGLLVTYTGAWQPPVRPAARSFYEAPYRDQQIKVWEASALSGNGASAAPGP
jgi:4-amino-4-deoxy-L-arabinose transferase-like glycosyltransferase